MYGALQVQIREVTNGFIVTNPSEAGRNTAGTEAVFKTAGEAIDHVKEAVGEKFVEIFNKDEG